MDQQFNEHTSLQLIESMINKAKNNFSESGTLYLVWGIVIFTCSIVQFIANYFYNNADVYYVWFLTWPVLIYQVFFLVKKAKKQQVKTYTDDILKYVWICFVILMFLLIFTLQYQKLFFGINPAILIVYGMPTFLSGIILKFKPLVLGGISCWLMAIGSVFFPFQFQSLFICAAVLFAWIIPGLLLRIKFKNQR